MKEIKENSKWAEEQNLKSIKEGEFWYIDTMFDIGTDIVNIDGSWFFTDEFLTKVIKNGDTWNDEIDRMEACHRFNKYEPEDIIKGLIDETITKDFAKQYLEWNKN